MLIVSPTEPAALRAIATAVSLRPEKYGADILARWNGSLVGVQRKEFGDLVSSMNDGRLDRQLAALSRLPYRAIILEGGPMWTNGMDGYDIVTGIPRRQLMGKLWSVGLWWGVSVIPTLDLNDTVMWVEGLKGWCQKREHGATSRPGPRGKWGTTTRRDRQRHLLQSFDGVGGEIADRILDHFGGVPLAWTVDEAEMMQVKGVGKERVKGMREVLE